MFLIALSVAYFGVRIPLLYMCIGVSCMTHICTKQLFTSVFTIRLGPRVKKFKNGYPESSKDCYSINLKKCIWCIRNRYIASFSELHNATRAKKVW